MVIIASYKGVHILLFLGYQYSDILGKFCEQATFVSKKYIPQNVYFKGKALSNFLCTSKNKTD